MSPSFTVLRGVGWRMRSGGRLRALIEHHVELAWLRETHARSGIELWCEEEGRS